MNKISQKVGGCLKTVLLLFVLQTSPLFADSSKLDGLFLKLKNAPNETAARQYEQQIWETWVISGDDNVDSLLREAMRQRDSYNLDGALETLNKIIALKPDFAEVWNQRATVYFHKGLYEESLIDVAKTLELEPRHFGSLAGRAVIRLRQGKPIIARNNIIEALKYHPYLKERAFFPGLEAPKTQNKQTSDSTDKS